MYFLVANLDFSLESQHEKCGAGKGNVILSFFYLFQKCLVVAVGSGFAIFDVVTGKLLTERRNAHKLKILHMEFIKERLENILMNDCLSYYGYYTITQGRQVVYSKIHHKEVVSHEPWPVKSEEYSILNPHVFGCHIW